MSHIANKWVIVWSESGHRWSRTAIEYALLACGLPVRRMPDDRPPVCMTSPEGKEVLSVLEEATMLGQALSPTTVSAIIAAIMLGADRETLMLLVKP